MTNCPDISDGSWAAAAAAAALGHGGPRPASGCPGTDAASASADGRCGPTMCGKKYSSHASRTEARRWPADRRVMLCPGQELGTGDAPAPLPSVGGDINYRPSGTVYPRRAVVWTAGRGRERRRLEGEGGAEKTRRGSGREEGRRRGEGWEGGSALAPSRWRRNRLGRGVVAH